jgi:D-3-phosphoglycerate dehydrogenase
VALRAKGFQMRIVAYDPFWPQEFAREHGIERVEIDELLHVSDVVSIHTPLLPETKGIIDSEALRRMKPTAILVNAARGGIIKEADLYRALKDGVIAGAGIDVFEEEPPADSPLLELDNVVLTPHTAAFTGEALNNMSMGVVDQLIDYVQGKRPAYMVNPDVFRPWRGEGLLA